MARALKDEVQTSRDLWKRRSKFWGYTPSKHVYAMIGPRTNPVEITLEQIAHDCNMFVNLFLFGMSTITLQAVFESASPEAG